MRRTFHEEIRQVDTTICLSSGYRLGLLDATGGRNLFLPRKKIAKIRPRSRPAFLSRRPVYRLWIAIVNTIRTRTRHRYVRNDQLRVRYIAGSRVNECLIENAERKIGKLTDRMRSVCFEDEDNRVWQSSRREEIEHAISLGILNFKSVFIVSAARIFSSRTLEIHAANSLPLSRNVIYARNVMLRLLQEFFRA